MRGGTVVKIGGSVAEESGRLCPILHRLADTGGKIVIVPGGGVFAEAVRDAQAGLGFGDALAHRLALDAMTTMARVFVALEPRLALAGSVAAIISAWQRGTIPVWHPVALRDGHPGIAESWDVTSDSLAIWIATELEAQLCVLVKSAQAPGGVTPEELAWSGLVDAALPRFAAAFGGELLVHGPGDGDIHALLGRTVVHA